jgi:hypothetical protein
VSPIASAVDRFRDEFVHYVEHGRPIDGIERHAIGHHVGHGSAVGAHV